MINSKSRQFDGFEKVKTFDFDFFEGSICSVINKSFMIESLDLHSEITIKSPRFKFFNFKGLANLSNQNV